MWLWILVLKHDRLSLPGLQIEGVHLVTDLVDLHLVAVFEQLASHEALSITDLAFGGINALFEEHCASK